MKEEKNPCGKKKKKKKFLEAKKKKNLEARRKIITSRKHFPGPWST